MKRIFAITQSLRAQRFRRNILCALLLLTSGCTDLFYYPMREHVAQPLQVGVQYEDIIIQDDDEPDLHGWLLKATPPVRGVIVQLHGNAQNVSTHFQSVAWLPAAGYEVLVFDYRGYGQSQGSPEIEGIHRDVLRALHFARQRESDQPCILLGQSIGAAMALYTAGRYGGEAGIDALVLESPFYSYSSVARDSLRSLGILRYPVYPFSLFISDKFSPSRVLLQIPDIPVVLIHGEEDPVVDISHSEKIHQLLGERLVFWRVSGGGHIAAFQQAEYRQRLLRFLAEIPGAKSRAINTFMDLSH